MEDIVTDTAQYSPPDGPQAPGTHHNHVRVQIRRRFQNSFSGFFGVRAADYAGYLNGEKNTSNQRRQHIGFHFYIFKIKSTLMRHSMSCIVAVDFFGNITVC